MKHLNPRQGITTQQSLQPVAQSRPGTGVKHLNPRQGITTVIFLSVRTGWCTIGVKHLNPRQGITTVALAHVEFQERFKCETPKSPPGDYNKASTPLIIRYNEYHTCVKHLNPRQGITTQLRVVFHFVCLPLGVKHLNPRQGITTVFSVR